MEYMSEEKALVPLDKEKALAAFNADGDAFEQDAAAHGVTDAGRLGFSGNTGKWKAGNDEIEAGSQFVFNVNEAARGWIAWKNNKPIAFHWAKIAERQVLPPAESLEDHWDGVPKGKRPKETDGWSNVVRIPVRDCIGGPQLDITLPAESSYRPINKLLLQYGRDRKFHVDPGTGSGFKMPLVEIDSEAFDSKGGTKYAPVLKIVNWLSEDDMTKLLSEVENPAAADAASPAEVKVEEAKAAAPKSATPFKRQRVGG